MPYEVFDLGKVLQTAEALKGMKQQSAFQQLQSQYLGSQIKNEEAKASSAQQQAAQTAQLENTRILNAAMRDISTNPAQAAAWLPELKRRGVIDPNFDHGTMDPEQLKSAATSIYRQTGALLDALDPKTPIPVPQGGRLVNPRTMQTVVDNPAQPKLYETRHFDRDGKTISQQWNGTAWVELGSSPKWNPNAQSMTVTSPDGTTVQVGGSSPQGLSKQTVQKYEEAKKTAIESLARLNSIEQSYSGEYLDVFKRGAAEITALKSKFGMGVSPDAQKFRTNLVTFRRNALTNVNRTIQDLTGAAMGVEEAKRIVATLPNPGVGIFDGDSKIDFEASLKSAIADTKRAIMRFNYAVKNNIDPLNTGVELADVDNLMDRRGGELEGIYRKRNPTATESEITGLVKETLQREFGLK